jgi:hypothetical protein
MDARDVEIDDSLDHADGGENERESRGRGEHNLVRKPVVDSDHTVITVLRPGTGK